jgi:hypothetical protein
LMGSLTNNAINFSTFDMFLLVLAGFICCVTRRNLLQHINTLQAQKSTILTFFIAIVDKSARMRSNALRKEWYDHELQLY